MQDEEGKERVRMREEEEGGRTMMRREITHDGEGGMAEAGI